MRLPVAGAGLGGARKTTYQEAHLRALGARPTAAVLA